MKIRLPKRKNISAIDHEDPLLFYYLHPNNYVFKQRLEIAMRIMGDKKFERLLTEQINRFIF